MIDPKKPETLSFSEQEQSNRGALDQEQMVYTTASCIIYLRNIWMLISVPRFYKVEEGV